MAYMTNIPLPKWPYRSERAALAARKDLMESWVSPECEAARKAIRAYNTLPPASGKNPFLRHKKLAPVPGLAALGQGTEGESLVVPLYDWRGDALAIQAIDRDGNSAPIFGAIPPEGLFFSMARVITREGGAFESQLRTEHIGTFQSAIFPSNIPVYVATDFATALSLYSRERVKPIDVVVVYAIDLANANKTVNTLRLAKCYHDSPDMRQDYDFVIIDAKNFKAIKEDHNEKTN